MDNIEQQSVVKYNKSYYRGFREALRKYAWWRDGEQFVGIQNEQFVGCGVKSLKDALAEVDEEERRNNEKCKLAGSSYDSYIEKVTTTPKHEVGFAICQRTKEKEEE